MHATLAEIGGRHVSALAAIYRPLTPEQEMLSMTHSHDAAPTQVPEDAVEAVVPYMPIVLPIVGGLMMLLLAFIAVTMA